MSADNPMDEHRPIKRFVKIMLFTALLKQRTPVLDPNRFTGSELPGACLGACFKTGSYKTVPSKNGAPAAPRVIFSTVTFAISVNASCVKNA